MPPAGKKPITVSNFKIEIGGLAAEHFRTVSGFDISVDNIDELTVGATAQERTRFPTAGPQWQEITIEQALTKDLALWDWFKTSHITGQWEEQMKEGTLSQMSPDWKTPRLTYAIHEAWPVSYSIPALDAGNTGMATESLTIAMKFERTT
jgi:phage tail-like protein